MPMNVFACELRMGDVLRSGQQFRLHDGDYYEVPEGHVLVLYTENETYVTDERGEPLVRVFVKAYNTKRAGNPHRSFCVPRGRTVAVLN